MVSHEHLPFLTMCRNDGFVQFSGAARNGTLPNLALMPSILLLTSGVFFGCLIELPFAVLCVLAEGSIKNGMQNLFQVSICLKPVLLSC